MKTDTRKNILGYIHTQSQTRVVDIIHRFNITNVMVHRHLRKLEEEGSINRVGKPPKVFYFPRGNKKP